MDFIEKLYHTYITMNKNNTVIYVGVTGDIERRIGQHKFNKIKGFTRRYNVDKLVYFEEFGYIEDAIKREKEIKGWRRSKKFDLIKKSNPELKDLSEGWNISEIPDNCRRVPPKQKIPRRHFFPPRGEKKYSSG